MNHVRVLKLFYFLTRAGPKLDWHRGLPQREVRSHPGNGHIEGGSLQVRFGACLPGQHEGLADALRGSTGSLQKTERDRCLAV